MKAIPGYYLLSLLAISSSQLRAKDVLPELSSIAAAVGFPVSELAMRNTLVEDNRINRESYINSYRIISPRENAFYPIQVTIAKQGTFLEAGALKKISTADAHPDGPLHRGGRGPFGSLEFDGGKGGVYFGEAKIGTTEPSLVGYAKRPAFIAEFRVPASGTDIRIAIIDTFEAKKMNKVPGGEKYFESFNPPTEEGEERSSGPTFDHKKVLAALGKLAAAAPSVNNTPKGTNASESNASAEVAVDQNASVP